MNGIYKISNMGKVINIKRSKILKPEITKNGYLRVKLFKNGKMKNFFVHRLVAEYFIKTNIINHELKYFQVNHKDGNKLNNNYKNLEWCSAKENTIHSLQNGLKKMKITYNKYEDICKEYQKGKTLKQIATEFGVHHTRIRDILKECNIKIRKKGRIKKYVSI